MILSADVQICAGWWRRGITTFAEGIGQAVNKAAGLAEIVDRDPTPAIGFAGAATRGSADAARILAAARRPEQRLQEREVKLSEEGNRILASIVDELRTTEVVRVVGSLLDGFS